MASSGSRKATEDPAAITVGDDRLAGRPAGGVGGLDGEPSDDGAPEQHPPQQAGANEEHRRHDASMAKPQPVDMIGRRRGPRISRRELGVALMATPCSA